MDYYLAPYVAKSYVRNCAQYIEIITLNTNKNNSEIIKNEFITPLIEYIDDNGHILTDEGKELINTYFNKQIATTFDPDEAWTKDIKDKMHVYALKKTTRDTYQAMEAMIHNLCTMQSRAGSQVPFSNVNFGTDTSEEGRMVIEQFLLASEAGLGAGETAIFPISIMMLKKGITDKGSKNYDLFKLACRVSAKRGLPNLVNEDAPFNAQYYKEGHPETLVPSMGMTKDGEVLLEFTYSNKYHEVFKLDISEVPQLLIQVEHIIKQFDHTFKFNYIQFDEYTKYIDFENISDLSVYTKDSLAEYPSKVKKFMVCTDPNTKWYKIGYTMDGKVQKFLYLTEDHPLVVAKPAEYQRIQVKDLEFGDHLVSNSYVQDPNVIVVKIDKLEENYTGYDFETVTDRFDLDKIISHNCRTRVIGNTYDPEQQVAPGRGNLFSITLNLPYLALEVKESLKDTWDTLSHEERFNAYIEALNARHDQCFGCLDDRFEIIARRKAKNFPFLLGQHLYLGSDNLEPEDEVREVIKHGTIVTGFIGLAETLVVLFGKHHGESDESQEYGLKIIKHINDRCIARAKAKKLNYSCMGSPSEGCCGRLLRLTRKRFGVIPGVTDHEYLTNSSHKLLWH